MSNVYGGLVVGSGDERSQRFVVHVDTLEESAKTLDDLARLIQERMLDPMRTSLSVSTEAHGSPGKSEATLIFGSFDGALAAASKYKAHYEAAHASAENLLKSLHDTAESTRQMAKKYRDAEHASKARVQDVERLLTGAATEKAPASAPDPDSYHGSTAYQTETVAAAKPASGDELGGNF